MGKRYLYFIVLTLFCLVEEIKAGIICKDQIIIVKLNIECKSGDTKEHDVTMKKIEDAFPKNRKKEDVRYL